MEELSIMLGGCKYKIMEELSIMLGGCYKNLLVSDIENDIIHEDDIIDYMLTPITSPEKETEGAKKSKVTGGATKDEKRTLYLVDIDLDKLKPENAKEDFQFFNNNIVEPFLKECDKTSRDNILKIKNEAKNMAELQCVSFSDKPVNREYGNYIEENLNIILGKPKARYVYQYYKKEANSTLVEYLKQVIYTGRGTGPRQYNHLINLYQNYTGTDASFKNRTIGDLASKGNDSVLYIRKVRTNCSDKYYKWLESSIISLYGLENTTNEIKGDKTNLRPFTAHCFAFAALYKCFESKVDEEWQVCLFECKKCKSDEDHKYRRKNVGNKIELRCTN
uniref:Exonuclease n=1 Tax=Rhabditophanes sp. KR3021 TaxID=114890 RepID=A0AC35UBC7_9BILA